MNKYSLRTPEYHIRTPYERYMDEKYGVWAKYAMVLNTGVTSPPAEETPYVSSITRRNITWNFNTEYLSGTFANGDYWVVDPGTGIVINSISPSSTSGARTMNGSMLNPFIVPGTTSDYQGYDSGMAVMEYSSALNVALDVSVENPLIITAGNTLVSSESEATAGVLPQVKSVEYLTVLAEAPAAGSFRPAYASVSKTINYNTSSLDYSKLTNLAIVSGQPTIATVANYFNRGSWHDAAMMGVERYIHPTDAMSNYGREISGYLGIGAMTLLSNFTQAEKATILIPYLQIAIDFWGIVSRGGEFTCSGGHHTGRLFPIMFLGYMFEDQNILNIFARTGDYLLTGGHYPGNEPEDYLHFSENDQTFYISQFEVDFTHSEAWAPSDADGPPIPYETSDIGTAEWGINHAVWPPHDNKAWYAVYRIVVGQTLVSHALPALILGLKTTWNHDCFFDWVYRYMENETIVWDTYFRSIYNNYWDTYYT